MEAARNYSRDELGNKKYSELQKISKALGVKGGRLKTDKLIEAILEAQEASEILSEDAGNIATALAEAAVKDDDSMETQDIRSTPSARRGGSEYLARGMNGSPRNVNSSPMQTHFSPHTNSSQKVSSSDCLQRPESPSNLMGNLSLNKSLASESPEKEKIKRKKMPKEKNQFVGRLVQPKNALVCLNELCPKAVYTNGKEVGVSFHVEVEVLGKIYHGYGSSKQAAKQAAAESALVSFVQTSPESVLANNNVKDSESDKENALNSQSRYECIGNKESGKSDPMAVDDNETNSQDDVKNINGKKQITDTTPWATLASFALYKLFHNWHEGKIGEQPQNPSVMSKIGASLISPATGKQNVFVQMGLSQSSSQISRTATEAINAYLGVSSVRSAALGEPGKVPQPAKQLPDDAQKMNPVMLLHQMRPMVKYTVVNSTKDSRPHYTITSEIDGQTFSGEGSRVKKAKFFLAKEAIEKLFGVNTTVELPA